MRVLVTSTLLALVASGALAAPALSRRNGGGGGGSSAPPPSTTCSSGSNYCNNGGKWTKGSQDCETGNVYCCDSAGGVLNALNCVNALNGDTISVNLGGGREVERVVRRNGGGGSSQPPPTSYTCDSGSNYCNNGGQWTKGSQDCETGNVYCCSSSGVGANALNCLNVLDGSTVDLDLGDLLGGGGETEKRVVRRNGGGGGGSQSPPPSDTCDSGSNYCNNGGKWTKGSQDCSTGNVYCCSSSGAAANALNCLNILDGSTVDLDLGDLLGGGETEKRVVRRNGGGGSSQPPPTSDTCDSGSNYCNNGGKWTKGSQDCETGSVYCCSSTGGLNALNCVNALNGDTIVVDLGDSVPVISRRNGGGGSEQQPPPSNTCDSGSNFCSNGGTWTKGSQDCSTGDVYCCSSTGGLLDAANCVNALDGSDITVDLGDLLGGGSVSIAALKRRNGGGGEQQPPPSNTCDSGSNFCNNGGKWTKGSQNCTTGDVYCCSSTGGLLNAANCLNVLDGSTISVDTTDLMGICS